MNPFGWSGPRFLLFYLVFAAVLILVLHLVRRAAWSSREGAGRLNLTDPYEIAYLRGGQNEAIRVAVIGLIERGLLEVRDQIELVITLEGKRTKPRDLLEDALLRFFAVRRQAADAFKLNKEAWAHALAGRQTSLERAGLLADEAQRAFRRHLGLAGAALLAGVAGAKLWIALAAGRRNFGFLIFVSLVMVCFELAVLWHFRRTSRGNEAMADLKQLFDTGSGSGAAPVAGPELVMTAAVFGLAALPAMAAPYVADLYPRAFKDSGGAGGGGCGSACGSSCGGGGGCGGGCGGCGG